MNDKSKNMYKRLSAPIFINQEKRSNSTINLLNGSANNFFIFNNKKSI